ncbi:unnamed protein product [Vitrella brassicaformis CCMP3155]|uniref:RING-type domain-containing protein n=1 Tax=Vitrella brassicaformis (strain CCMP3155) TaxID=1169540 RepID=A0A0G4F2A8_VITBC|nr:unnamed protein product [Vitrella brassicaformis CCMP3155]|eukprot:CEM05677.1 unnamed protein product [Vitrella brassicaformis CCMP3155]
MAGAGEPDESLSTCEVCLTEYDTTRRVPQILSRCGHTFCSDCIGHMQKLQPEVTCPSCRIVTPAHEVRRNFALCQVVELAHVGLGGRQEAKQCKRDDIPVNAFGDECDECVCPSCYITPDAPCYAHKRSHIKDAVMEKLEVAKRTNELLQSSRTALLERGTRSEKAQEHYRRCFSNAEDEVRSQFTRTEDRIVQKIREERQRALRTLQDEYQKGVSAFEQRRHESAKLQKNIDNALAKIQTLLGDAARRVLGSESSSKAAAAHNISTAEVDLLEALTQIEADIIGEIDGSTTIAPGSDNRTLQQLQNGVGTQLRPVTDPAPGTGGQATGQGSSNLIQRMAARLTDATPPSYAMSVPRVSPVRRDLDRVLGRIVDITFTDTNCSEGDTGRNLGNGRSEQERSSTETEGTHGRRQRAAVRPMGVYVPPTNRGTPSNTTNTEMTSQRTNGQPTNNVEPPSRNRDREGASHGVFAYAANPVSDREGTTAEQPNTKTPKFQTHEEERAHWNAQRAAHQGIGAFEHLDMRFRFRESGGGGVVYKKGPQWQNRSRGRH